MSKIPDNVLDKSTYMKAKKKADETYKVNSAYKSMFLVSEYKRLGGKYSGKKENTGVKRWNEEKWIQVLPFIESGKKVPCGFGSSTKSCRPSKRIDKQTPMTVQELQKKHGKKKLVDLANKKRKNMTKRVNWEEASIN